MYRTAARLQRFPGVVDDPEPTPCRWAVIGFRRGRDNKRRSRVFRRVWPCNGNRQVENVYRKWSGGNWYLVRVTDGQVEPREEWNQYFYELVQEWKDARKGVNRDADPYRASAYSLREIGGAETLDEQQVMR